MTLIMPLVGNRPPAVIRRGGVGRAEDRAAARGRAMPIERRRFPPPWEMHEAKAFCVRDACGDEDGCSELGELLRSVRQVSTALFSRPLQDPIRGSLDSVP